jgi:hypothetical protein
MTFSINISTQFGFLVRLDVGIEKIWPE